MTFDFSNLFHLLKHKGISKEFLRKTVGISPNTISKLSNNEPVSLEILANICDYLECDLDDIMKYTPKEKPLLEKTIINKGDIFLVNVPARPVLHELIHENYREFLGTRPYLVYQSSKIINAHKNDVVLAIPFTSRIRMTLPTDVLIEPSEQNNLQHTAKLPINNMRMLAKVQLVQKYGFLSKTDLKEVDKACKIFFDL